MTNPLSNIIKKIKSKNKDLNGLWVAVDKYGKIIAFDFDLEEVRDSVGRYNWEIAKRGKPVYYLRDVEERQRVKKCL